VLSGTNEQHKVLKYLEDNDIEYVPIRELKEEHIH